MHAAAFSLTDGLTSQRFSRERKADTQDFVNAQITSRNKTCNGRRKRCDIETATARRHSPDTLRR